MKLHTHAATAPSPARFSAFDYVVLAGAAMNLLVVAVLIGFWLVVD